jgi:hypothetical protein
MQVAVSSLVDAVQNVLTVRSTRIATIYHFNNYISIAVYTYGDAVALEGAPISTSDQYRWTLNIFLHPIRKPTASFRGR